MSAKNPRGFRALILSSAAVALVAGSGAFAAESDTLEEVVVTARHVKENLKDSPIAVSAFSEDQLATVGAKDITDLTYMTPSTSMFAGRGSNSTLTAYIRGIGQQDPTWGSEPGVGLYVDDVYYARPQAAVLDIYNVSQIEVLRGPQGTLYGRNTIGGAIKYVTSDLPSTPTADARVSYGSYNERDFVASFSAPIDEKVRVGGSVARFLHDGWGKDLTTGAQIDNRNVWAGRATIELLPSDNFTIKINADDTVDKSNANPGHKELPFGGYPVLGNDYDSYAGMSSYNYVTDKGISLTATWEVNSALTVKSTTAYRDGRSTTNIDFDGTPIPYLDVPAHYYDHQTSEEIQATYQVSNFRGVAGVFYMDSLAGGDADFEFQQLIAVPLSEYLYGHILTNSWAGYFDGSYDLDDKWTVSAGSRYSDDAKTGRVYQALYIGIPSPFFGGAARPAFRVNTDYASHKSWADFTPRVSVSYKLTPDITSYVSFSEGFRSGGFDIRGNQTVYPATANGFRPEKEKTYEVGLKGDYLGRKLQINLDGFYSDYTDQQQTMSYALPTGLLQVVENAAASHIEGIELEAVAKVTSGLRATLAGGYTSAGFDTFDQLPFKGVGALPSVRGMQYTPKWTGSLDLAYTLPLDNGSVLTSSGNVAYRSLTQIYNTPSVIDQPGYWLLGANIVWTDPSGHYSVGLKATNLTDERYRIGGYNFLGAHYGNSVVGFYGPPQSVLATVEAKF